MNCTGEISTTRRSGTARSETAVRTFAKGLLEDRQGLFQVARFSIGCAVVRDGVGWVGGVDKIVVTSVAVDVYDMRAHPAGHDYGCKDCDQSRDWCAFAANGIGLDQTVPARGGKPVFGIKDGI